MAKENTRFNAKTQQFEKIPDTQALNTSSEKLMGMYDRKYISAEDIYDAINWDLSDEKEDKDAVLEKIKDKKNSKARKKYIALAIESQKQKMQKVLDYLKYNPELKDDQIKDILRKEIKSPFDKEAFIVDRALDTDTRLIDDTHVRAIEKATGNVPHKQETLEDRYHRILSGMSFDYKKKENVKVDDVVDTPIEDVIDTNDVAPEPEINDEEYRIRSLNSDENEFIRDIIQLKVLKDMGIIDDKLYQAAIKDPEHAIEALKQKRPLNDKEQQEFKDNMALAYLADTPLKDILPQEVFESLKKSHPLYDLDTITLFEQQPPSVLVELYERSKEKEFEKYHEKVGKRMDGLTAEYQSGISAPIAFQQYNFDDNTNIADVYDGYMAMLDARRPDVNTEQQKNIDSCKEKLDNDLKQYLSAWNLDVFEQNHANGSNIGQLADNLEQIQAQMQTFELEQETLKWMKEAIQFKSADGKSVEPQIEEKDGKLSVIEGSKLATLIDFSKESAMISTLASGDKLEGEDAKIKLQIAIEDHIMTELYGANIAEESLKGVYEQKDAFNDKNNRSKFITRMISSDRKLEISDFAYNSLKQNNVNNINACIEQMSKTTGRNNPILQKIHAPIAKYDSRGADRFKSNGQGKVSFWKTAAFTFGAGMASKASTAIIASTGAVSYGAAAGVTAIGLSTVGMLINYKNFKKEMKAKGEKPQVKKFLFGEKGDRKYALMNLGSTLGMVAGASLMTGHPEIAAVAGVASLGIMGYQTFQNARNNGMTKQQAWRQVGKRLGGMVLGGTASAWLSAQFGNPTHQEQISEGRDAVEGTPDKTVKTYTTEQIDKVTARNEANTTYEYDSDGINNIDSYRNPDNYHQEAWFSQEEHDNAISALKEQMPKLGWKEDAGNEEVMLRKICAFERLHRNGEFVLDNGETVSDRFGDVSTLLKNLLDGKLTPEDAKTVDLIQENMGADGHSKLIPPLGNDLYSYQDHDNGIISDTIKGTPGQEAVAPEFKTVEDVSPAVGYWEPVKGVFSKLKSRIGSFADKIAGKTKQEDKKILPPQQEPKKITPTPHIKDNSNDFIIKEYEIVHGVKLDPEKDKAEIVRYKGLVLKEQQAEQNSQLFEDYLQTRMDKFEQELKTNVAPLDESKGFVDSKKGREDINETRQTMWHTNLAYNQEPLETKNATLTHFGILSSMRGNSASKAEITAAQDTKRAPLPLGKQDRPHDGTLDLATRKTHGQTINRGKGINDASLVQAIKNKKSHSK